MPGPSLPAPPPPAPCPSASAPTVGDSPWADPGPLGEGLALEDFPTFVIGRLAAALQRDVTTAYLDAFELNAPQWRMLAALATYSPIAFSELVKLSMSDKALVSRAMQVLVERGLAHTQPDPTHAKKVVCKISSKGRKLYQRLLPRAQQAQAELLGLLERDERMALYAALSKLRVALGVVPPAPPVRDVEP